MAVPSSVPLIRYDLAHYGVVTQVVNATTFRAAGMVGQGDGTFQNYFVYVLKKGDRTTNAPHRERETCVAYTSATGEFIHLAFTSPLSVGDSILLLHPILEAAMPSEIDDRPGSTTHNWQVAEQTVTTIGGIGATNKIHSLLLDISTLTGNITVRLYHNINGVQRQTYSQVFSVAADGPGLWIINGTLAIHGLLVVSAQSDDAADNGRAIGWEYLIEGI